MNMLSNEKVNFKSLEENIFKEMMKLGREIIQEELRMLDKLILDYRDKEIFVPKDFQSTTIKTKLGEIPIARRRYKMVINGKCNIIYLLDELLEINDFGLYSQGIVEMVAREITKKSYRETAKTISEDTDNTISHTAVRNIVLKLGEKIKKIEEEKIKLYEEGKIEGNKESEYIFCEHDGIYIKKQKSKKHKGKKKFKVKHFKKKKGKKKKNGIELKIAVIHEGKEPRYTNDYKLKNKIIVGTASKAKDLKKIEDTTIGTTYKEYEIKKVVINGDGADWTGSIVEGCLLVDLDKIPSGAKWRIRKEGDFIEKFGGGIKKLKTYFMDKKIPVRLRNYLPVLAVGSEILAVAGVDISEQLRVTENTKNFGLIKYNMQNWA